MLALRASPGISVCKFTIGPDNMFIDLLRISTITCLFVYQAASSLMIIAFMRDVAQVDSGELWSPSVVGEPVVCCRIFRCFEICNCLSPKLTFKPSTAHRSVISMVIAIIVFFVVINIILFSLSNNTKHRNCSKVTMPIGL